MSTINSYLLLLSKEIIRIVRQIGELVNVQQTVQLKLCLKRLNVCWAGRRVKCIPHVYLSIKMPQGTHTRQVYGTGTTSVDSASVQRAVVLILRLCKTTAVTVKWELARRCSRMLLRKTAQWGPTVSLGTAVSNESVVSDPSDR
jgi:hypothetical protein